MRKKMEKVLVTYSAHSGTPRDVAEAIAEEITKTDHGLNCSRSTR
jgi:flavodoxin